MPMLNRWSVTAPPLHSTAAPIKLLAALDGSPRKGKPFGALHLCVRARELRELPLWSPSCSDTYTSQPIVPVSDGRECWVCR